MITISLTKILRSQLTSLHDIMASVDEESQFTKFAAVHKYMWRLRSENDVNVVKWYDNFS